MGFLSGIFRSRDKPTDSTVGSRYAFSMGGTPAGKSVTEKTAMRLLMRLPGRMIPEILTRGLPGNRADWSD